MQFNKILNSIFSQCSKPFSSLCGLKCNNISRVHHTPYQLLLNFFKVVGLSERRDIHDIRFLFKLINGLIDCPEILNFLILCPSVSLVSS